MNFDCITVKLTRKLNALSRAVKLCVVLIALSSCSAITALTKAALEDTGSLTAQVGQSNESNKLKAEMSNETKQSTDITSESVQIFNTNISPIFIVLLILGWLLPSPHEIWKTILRLTRCSKR